MLQQSKILQSRNEWKTKATQRGYEIREFRKAQTRHLEKIVMLKLQNKKMEEIIQDKKKQWLNPIVKQWRV
jgi:hypothetical protein